MSFCIKRTSFECFSLKAKLYEAWTLDLPFGNFKTSNLAEVKSTLLNDFRVFSDYHLLKFKA